MAHAVEADLGYNEAIGKTESMSTSRFSTTVKMAGTFLVRSLYHRGGILTTEANQSDGGATPNDFFPCPFVGILVFGFSGENHRLWPVMRMPSEVRNKKRS